MSREAMQQALEVIQDYRDEYGPHREDSGAAYIITALKERLAQEDAINEIEAEAKKKLRRMQDDIRDKLKAQPVQDDGVCRHCGGSGCVACDARCLPEQPVQEPVVKHMMEWVEYLKRQSDHGQHLHIPSGISAGTCWELAIELEQFISTAPQRREWVGLDAAIAAEREACAKVCDEQGVGRKAMEHYAALTYSGAAHDCAAAIRARGKA